MTKELRLLELMIEAPYLSANKINAILRKEYGAGYRKQHLLVKMREIREKKKKADAEKYIRKVYVEKKSVMIVVVQYTTFDRLDELEIFYNRALRKRKDEIKRLILEGLKKYEEKEEKDKKRYFAAKIESGSKEHIERAEGQEAAEENYLHSKTFVITQEKNMLAYIYALQQVLGMDVTKTIFDLEQNLDKKIL